MKNNVHQNDNYFECEMLKQWINSKYLTLKMMKKLHLKFKSAKPYSFLELPHFLNKNIVTEIKKELLKQEFKKKEADLFLFYQTNDLSNCKNKVIKDFYLFLSSKVLVRYIKYLTGISLKSKKIDLSGTKYTKNNYLLPHDDRLEGRAVAYFLYLSNLSAKDGGKLQMYGKNNSGQIEVIKSIIPKNNTFAFFAVSNMSFHQVEEITSNKERIALSGWFHHD